MSGLADKQAEVNAAYASRDRRDPIPGEYVRKLTVVCDVEMQVLPGGHLVPFGESTIYAFESDVAKIKALVADPVTLDENTVETDPTNIERSKAIFAAKRAEFLAKRGLTEAQFAMVSHEYDGPRSWPQVYCDTFVPPGRLPTEAELAKVSPGQRREFTKRMADPFKQVLPLRKVVVDVERFAPPQSVEAQQARMHADTMTQVIADAVKLAVQGGNTERPRKG